MTHAHRFGEDQPNPNPKPMETKGDPTGPVGAVMRRSMRCATEIQKVVLGYGLTYWPSTATSTVSGI